MDFEKVFHQELQEIARRRSRRDAAPEQSARDGDGPVLVLDAIRAAIAADASGEGDTPRDLTGIAISGGGIRSATFALGVLQALSERRLFERADYLSTVSGGGYIGSCLSSMFANGERRFPFRPGPGQRERAPIRHLRRYSNYLLPQGFLDVLRMPGVLLRGILATGLFMVPVLMLAVIALVVLAGGRISDALVNGTAAVVDVSMALDARGQPDYAFNIRRAMVKRPAPPGRDHSKCAADEEHRWSPATNRVVETFSGVVEQIPCTRGDFVVYGLPEGTLLQTAAPHHCAGRRASCIRRCSSPSC